ARNRAGVEADAAERRAPLDHGDAAAHLCGLNGAALTSGPAADAYQIVVVSGGHTGCCLLECDGTLSGLYMAVSARQPLPSHSMTTRRDFLRNAALLSGAAFSRGSIPASIARALSIDPPPGTTFRDAEHVVIFMQENRSFDHCFGALRGVRGFRDPRAHVQPNGNGVWFQTDAQGDTYAPFHLDIANTNATWVGGLPHTWPDQVDARAGGRYDQWLIAKPKKNL